MAVPYNHKAIEKKWERKNGAENPVNPKVDEKRQPEKEILLSGHVPRIRQETVFM